MTTHALAEFAVVVASVLLLALPLGTWIARVMEPGVRPLPLARVERAAWRLLRTTPEDDMHWSRHAIFRRDQAAAGTGVARMVGGEGRGTPAPLTERCGVGRGEANDAYG